ncbi:hypothetical protein ACP70R_010127 [Stipagrostis hirtigluma subsp. patula]
MGLVLSRMGLWACRRQRERRLQEERCRLSPTTMTPAHRARLSPQPPRSSVADTAAGPHGGGWLSIRRHHLQELGPLDVRLGRLPLPLLHYTEVAVGTPKTTFLVALDTGSDLIWVPCDCKQCAPLVNATGPSEPDLQRYSLRLSSTSKAVPCGHALCGRPNACSGGAAGNSSCPYAVRYVSANTSSSGVLVKDMLRGGGRLRRRRAGPMVFKCGQVQTGAFLDGAAVDGLLGLGIKICRTRRRPPSRFFGPLAIGFFQHQRATAHAHANTHGCEQRRRHGTELRRWSGEEQRRGDSDDGTARERREDGDDGCGAEAQREGHRREAGRARVAGWAVAGWRGGAAAGMCGGGGGGGGGTTLGLGSPSLPHRRTTA